MSTPLHMVQLSVHAGRLFGLAQRHGHRAQDVDEGYAVHAALDASFGEFAPQPFSARTDRAGRLVVLGYAQETHDALRARAQQFAGPDAWSVWDWEQTFSKAMPTEFTSGSALGFEVRACPVVRVAKDRAELNLGGERVEARKKGAETDAFQARWFLASERGEPGPRSREEVYLPWLERELTRDRAASVVSAEMTAFHRVNLYRRGEGTGGRRGGVSEKPDARLRGVLRVQDPKAFDALLRRGVGRHRAFGFGMLLLRPA